MADLKSAVARRLGSSPRRATIRARDGTADMTVSNTVAAMRGSSNLPGRTNFLDVVEWQTR